MREKLASDKFQGRDKEKRKFEESLGQYNYNSSFVFNIYGRGGIGKTQLIKTCHDMVCDMEETENVIPMYVNVSDCYSVSAVLLRIRIQLSEDLRYCFDEFDIMYQFYFNKCAFLQESDIQKYKREISQDNKINKIYKKIKEDTTSRKTDLVAFITSLALVAVEQITEIPLISQIPLPQIIKNLSEVITDLEERKRLEKIIEEVGDRYLDSYEKERRLADYFCKALSQPLHLNSKNILFIDNFQKEEKLKNIQLMFKVFAKTEVFWVIGSREKLNYYSSENHQFKELELGRLEEKACEKLILKCDNIGLLEKENKNAVIHKIIETTNKFPLNLVVAIEVLHKQINSEIEKLPGNKDYIIDINRFTDMGEDYKELAFYFEMSKSQLELDCFHILSCLDVWDKKTISVVRECIGLYLLNTINILSNDSMIEFATNESIKLHEEIKDALLDSPNNRIKYDVYQLMTEYFLKVQDERTLTNARMIENFLRFAVNFCDEISKNKYPYLESDAFTEFKKFYEAFSKSVDLLKNNGNPIIFNPDFIAVYRKIVDKFVEIGENSTEYKQQMEAYKSKYKLGLLLYDSGDSKEAEKVDEEYLKFTKKNFKERKEALDYSIALNAVGVDLSANHNYSEALALGKLSIETALAGIKAYIDKNEQDELAVRIYNSYLEFDAYLIDGDVPVEVMRHMSHVLKDLAAREKTDSVRLHFEHLLKCRGNIPWYYIYNVEMIQNMWQYAIRYGQATYELRRRYFGEKDKRTLVSYHNSAVYKLKCYELSLEGKLHIENPDYKEIFTEVIDVLKDVYLKKCEYLTLREDVKADIETVKKLLISKSEEKNLNCSFNEIFSVKALEKLFPKEVIDFSFYERIKSHEVKQDSINYHRFMLLHCNTDALESLQYLSFALFCLARVQDNESDKQRLIKKSILYGNEVTIARMIALSSKHKRTLESLFYTGKYYYAVGNRGEAVKRVQVACANLDDSKVSKKYKEEYEKYLRELENKDCPDSVAF